MNSKSRKNIKYRNNKKTRKKSYKGGDKPKVQINPILINFKFKEHDKTKISSELLNKQLLGNNEFYIAKEFKFDNISQKFVSKNSLNTYLSTRENLINIEKDKDYTENNIIYLITQIMFPRGKVIYNSKNEPYTINKVNLYDKPRKYEKRRKYTSIKYNEDAYEVTIRLYLIKGNKPSLFGKYKSFCDQRRQHLVDVLYNYFDYDTAEIKLKNKKQISDKDRFNNKLRELYFKMEKDEFERERKKREGKEKENKEKDELTFQVKKENKEKKENKN